MAIFFGGAGADSISALGSVGFGGAILSPGAPDVVLGGDGADTIFGAISNASVATYLGGPGNDSIIGNGGTNTVLNGEDGDDILQATFGASIGAKILLGGPGNDSLIGNSLPDTMDGGQGNDTLSGSGGNDRLFGGDGADDISGDGDNDFIDGGSGGNALLGGFGNDHILGGVDGDFVVGNEGFDTLDGGHGNNTLFGGDDSDRIIAYSGADSIDGGDAGDHIDAGNGLNTVQGGAGDDRIFAGFDDDLIFGGANDTTDSGDYIDAHRGNNTVLGGFGTDNIIAGMGNDSLSGEDGDDRIEAGEGTNTLSGGVGNDSIFAAGGNDSIAGDDGNDSIHAGFGNNTVTGGAANDYIIAGGGADSLVGGIGNDSIVSAFGNDTLHGDDGNDYMDSGDSNDVLIGFGGNDTALAGAGNDSVFGGSGSNDRYDGGDGTDNLDYSGITAGFGVTITNLANQQRVVKRDAVTNVVSGVDTHANFESFIGSGSHDRITGSGWDETMTGGAGNDTMDGGGGFDALRYDSGPVGNIVVNLLMGYAQDNHGGIDRLRKETATNSYIEQVIAGAGADSLTGDSDSNWLRGAAGADMLDGGDGTNDYADYSGDADANLDGFGATVNLSSVAFGAVAAGTALDLSGATDILVNMESFSGSNFRDVFIASDRGGVYRAREGADTITGGGGYDAVNHRSDFDENGDGFGAIVNLSDAAVTVASWGSEGPQTVDAARARDAWGDVDILTGIEGAQGTFVNDLLVGRSREATFSLAGRDFHATERSFLRGLLGADTLRGQDTNDGTVSDHLDDTSGATIRLDLGTATDGAGYVDTLVNVRAARGSSMDDLIVAGADGSWLNGRAGDDTLTGGAGFDFLSHAGATEGVVADLAAGTSQDGFGWTDQLASIEGVSGGFFADRLTGNASDNLISGSRGADTIDGAGGEDIVTYYSAWQGVEASSLTGVWLNLQGGIARDGDGSPLGGSLDRLTSIEHAVGSHLADTLLGSSGANSIHGAEGDDSLSGGGGNDTLLGGAGNDTLDGTGGLDNTDGGAGNDLHIVNNRFDLVIEADGGGADTISATISYSLAATVFVETLVAAGGAALELGGNPFANTLIGNGGANRLDGSAGADDLYGLGGADTLIGGTGKDTLTGHDDADLFFYGRASESFRANVDWITDFESGVDKLAFASATNALFAGLTPAAMAFNGSVAVINAALGAGAETYAEVMSGLNAGLGGSGNVTASGATLQVWQVEVAGGSAAGSYLFVNDGIAGAATATDMLIAFTLAGGPIVGSDFILV